MAETANEANNYTNVVALRFSNSDSVQSASWKPYSPKQLELELGGERTILFVATDCIHGAVFMRHLHLLKPNLLVDLRFAPHFRFIGLSTDALAHSIEEIGAQYVWHGLPFHKISSSLLRHEPRELAHGVLSTAVARGRITGPIMSLVQHPSDAELFGPYLAGALSEQNGCDWKIEIVCQRPLPF